MIEAEHLDFYSFLTSNLASHASNFLSLGQLDHTLESGGKRRCKTSKSKRERSQRYWLKHWCNLKLRQVYHFLLLFTFNSTSNLFFSFLFFPFLSIFSALQHLERKLRILWYGSLINDLPDVSLLKLIKDMLDYIANVIFVIVMFVAELWWFIFLYNYRIGIELSEWINKWCYDMNKYGFIIYTILYILYICNYLSFPDRSACCLTCQLFHSLTHSLPHPVSQSVDQWFTSSLSHSLPPFPSLSLTQSLAQSVDQTVSQSALQGKPQMLVCNVYVMLYI